MITTILLTLLSLFGSSSQTPEFDHRFQFDAYSVINVSFDRKLEKDPVIRTEYSVFRECLIVPFMLLGTKNGKYHYQAIVRTPRIQAALIHFEGYWNPEKRLGFALVPGDSLIIDISLHEDLSVKAYHFDSPYRSFSQYYQDKSVEVGYVDARIQKYHKDHPKWDSLVKAEKAFVLRKAKEHRLPKWLEREEYVHAEVDYFSPETYVIAENDYEAMRLNDHFLYTVLYKILDKKTTCLLPGTWKLKNDLPDLKKNLEKVKSIEGCNNELVLHLLQQIVSKLKTEEDFEIFENLMTDYLSYPDYYNYLKEEIAKRKNKLYLDPFFEKLIELDLIEKNQSFVAYIKKDGERVVPKIQSFLDQFYPAIEILILDMDQNKVLMDGELICEFEDSEAASFCCLPIVIGYDQPKSLALLSAYKFNEVLDMMVSPF